MDLLQSHFDHCVGLKAALINFNSNGCTVYSIFFEERNRYAMDGYLKIWCEKQITRCNTLQVNLLCNSCYAVYVEYL